MPEISIIMPSLNVAPYIRECIESVIRQSFRDLEILCIDAGSTDGTEEILKQYALKDSRITLIHSSIKSYGYQVNMGISRASGRYIGIVETDDIIRKDMFERLYDAIKDTDLDFVKADYDVFFPLNGQYVFYRNSTFSRDKAQYGTVLYGERLLDLYEADFALWKGLYRKSFLTDNGIRLNESPGAAFQDVGFLIQTFAHARKVLYIDQALYCYRKARDGASMVSPHCLSYIKGEAAWILEEKIIKKFDAGNRKACIKRLMSVFLQQYRNALTLHNFDWQDRLLQDSHKWFSDNMDNFIKEYGVSPEDENVEIWKSYKEAIQEPEIFAQRCKKEFMRKQKYFQELREAGEFVLFGAGVTGCAFLRDCSIYDICPGAITDNNECLWGNKIGGIEIIPLTECMGRFPAAIYVIANIRHGHDIENQLRKEGVSDEQIRYAI